MTDRREQERNRDYLLMAAGVAGVVICLPALLAALLLGRLVRRYPHAFVLAGVAGIGVTAVLAHSITGQMRMGYRSVAAVGLALDPARAVEVAWPHVWRWWLLALGMTPAVAGALEVLRPKMVEDLRDQDERRMERQRARRERRARKVVGAQEGQRGEAFPLGRHVEGERLLPVRRGEAAMPLARLHKTLLVVGAPGSGKTETLLRLALGVASITNWAVFVLDAKGDEGMMRRFEARCARRGGLPALPLGVLRRLARHRPGDR